MGAGRPTKYDPALCAMVEKLALLGHTPPVIANVIGVAESTFRKWLAEHEELSDAFARGRDPADADVAVSLRDRALGYSHPAVKILSTPDGVVQVPYTEHYPPDTQAAMFWLRNRQPQLWKAAPEESAIPPAALPQKVVIEIQDGRRVPALVDTAAG